MNKSIRYIWKNKSSYLMFIPGFLILLVFAYYPMYGITLAFKEYNPTYGIMGSEWIGFDNFYYALTSYGFWEMVRNTLVLGLYNIVFAFPVSIILALQFNELRNPHFKKLVQTISYLPYFISWAMISGMMWTLLSNDYGLINNLLKTLGLEPIFWYAEPKYWRAILTIAGIWKTTGWGTITFLASIASIDPGLYEAAKIDGANRWKQTIHVTIPGMMPAICITFILTVSNIIRDDFDKIYALVGQNSLLEETTEVLGTWSYRAMLNSFKNYGYVTAVTTLQSVLGMILLIVANSLVKKTGDQGLF